MSRLLLLSILTLSLSSNAQHTGSGGDGVELPDGSITLADPFYDSMTANDHHRLPLPTGTPGRLGKVLTKELSKMKTALDKAYRMGDKTTSDLLGLEFGKEQSIEYTFVDELNDPRCVNHVKYQLPDGSKFLGPVGCNIFGNIFILKNIFEQMPLAIQIKLLVHENARNFTQKITLGKKKIDAPMTFKSISLITSGIEVFYRVNREQLDGKLRTLTDNEVGNLQNMVNELRNTEVLGSSQSSRWLEDLKVTKQGGGLVTGRTKIATDSFVTLTSTVNAKGNVQIGSGSLISSSTISGVASFDILSGISISRSQLSGDSAFTLASNSVVRDSYLTCYGDCIHEGVFDKKSIVENPGDFCDTDSTRFAGTIADTYGPQKFLVIQSMANYLHENCVSGAGYAMLDSVDCNIKSFIGTSHVSFCSRDDWRRFSAPMIERVASDLNLSLDSHWILYDSMVYGLGYKNCTYWNVANTLIKAFDQLFCAPARSF